MVGIIGYVTRSTEYNFPLHEVIFNYKWYFIYILEMYCLATQVAFGDEIEAVQKEAKALKDGGVEIIIALGHSGYEIDQA